MSWRVLGAKGTGKAIFEAALVLARMPYECAEDATEQGLLLPDGTLMTESAAIILYIDGLVPELGLVPNVRDPLRREMLRWLMFLVAAINPAYGKSDQGRPDDEVMPLWRLVEGAVRGPWFLGDVPSALDLYVSVMTRWSPGRAWFADCCPRLYAVATTVDVDPRLVRVWAANFA